MWKHPFKDHHWKQWIPFPQRTTEGLPSYQIGKKIKNCKTCTLSHLTAGSTASFSCVLQSTMWHTAPTCLIRRGKKRRFERESVVVHWNTWSLQAGWWPLWPMLVWGVHMKVILVQVWNFQRMATQGGKERSTVPFLQFGLREQLCVSTGLLWGQLQWILPLSVTASVKPQVKSRRSKKCEKIGALAENRKNKGGLQPGQSMSW